MLDAMSRIYDTDLATSWPKLGYTPQGLRVRGDGYGYDDDDSDGVEAWRVA